MTLKQQIAELKDCKVIIGFSKSTQQSTINLPARGRKLTKIDLIKLVTDCEQLLDKAISGLSEDSVAKRLELIYDIKQAYDGGGDE